MGLRNIAKKKNVLMNRKPYLERGHGEPDGRHVVLAEMKQLDEHQV